MPFKHNAARRHHIPRACYRITNWPAYEAGLRRRGDLTFWVDEAALAGWQAPRRSTPGGQPRYSALASPAARVTARRGHLTPGSRRAGHGRSEPADPARPGIWQRVCRDIQAEATEAAERKAAQAAAIEARGRHPSRLPATRRPTPVEPPPSRAVLRPAPPTNTDSAPAAPREIPEAARATLAALDRQLEWRDRYVNPPKRKD